MSGQASIEYLLLLAVIISFFSMLVPLLQQSYALSFFAADSIAAKKFTNSLELRAREMSFMGNGSSASIKAKPVEAWFLHAEGKILVVTAKNSFLAKEKSFEAELPSEITFQDILFEEEKVFFLRKENNVLLLEHN